MEFWLKHNHNTNSDIVFFLNYVLNLNYKLPNNKSSRVWQ